ncbi:hypothetical protein ACGFJ7_20670 [Actinoplanes sp. NPDC048988]|uniref:DUF7674 family protein n=1 Tax=Actinoplanes sp. NPDC048988 TaxID=3363901 RepID=UPI003721FFCF
MSGSQYSPIRTATSSAWWRQYRPEWIARELRRWFVDAVAAGNTRGVTDFLGAIEVRHGSEDPDTRNVVEVSFMEDLLVLPDANERAAIDVLHRRAGPRTLAGLIAARTYLHPPGDEPRPAS